MIRIFRLFFVLTVIMFGPTAWADERVNKYDGVAIEGYDPVAYFRSGKPVDGKTDITAEHDGAVWRFANEANRDDFLKDPAAYAPQYGGYCAWAVSKGYTAKIDPYAWNIVEGKLYLNYSRSVQKQWSEDVAGNISAGDANWTSIEKKLAQ